MEYFEQLGLEREPFSNSPDPELFFCSEKQEYCLQQLEISIRLRRGLNVILGEVGTGKTTLFRRLLQNLDDLECYSLLDPDVGSVKDLLSLILAKITKAEVIEDLEVWEYKERIKTRLLEKNLSEDKIVVFLIDEGQKLSRHGVEILRELLNFETNTNKLLQLVIFAQPEFKQHMQAMHNFTDRINFFYELKRFDLKECKTMIRKRLALCAAKKKTKNLFTPDAIKKIHIASKGRPRQIITLCHKLLLQLLIDKKKKVTGRMVDKYVFHKQGIPFFVKYIFLIFLFLFILFLLIQHLQIYKRINLNNINKQPVIEQRWKIKDNLIPKD